MPASDEWCTPEWLTGMLPPVDLDPCSNHNSTVRARCRLSLARGQDGLACPWHQIDFVSGVDQGAGVISVASVRTTFVNPPYSNVMPWVRRAGEFLAAGGECLMLVKLDPTTRWWAAAIDTGAYAYPFRKRIRFAGAPGVAPWPSALLHWDGGVYFEPFLRRATQDQVIW